MPFSINYNKFTLFLLRNLISDEPRPRKRFKKIETSYLPSSSMNETTELDPEKMQTCHKEQGRLLLRRMATREYF